MDSPLLYNTYYHIYNRGVNGEDIFISPISSTRMPRPSIKLIGGRVVYSNTRLDGF